MTTSFTSQSRARTGLRSATFTVGLVTTMAVAWTVTSGQAFAYTEPTPTSAAAPGSSQVGVPLSQRPVAVPDGARAELHRYGAQQVPTLSNVVLVSDSSGTLTHRTGDTAMHFRYGQADAY